MLKLVLPAIRYPHLTDWRSVRRRSSIRLFPFYACGIADYTASTAEEEDKNLRYNQILIIIAENRTYDDIIGKLYAPHNKAGRVCGGA